MAVARKFLHQCQPEPKFEAMDTSVLGCCDDGVFDSCFDSDVSHHLTHPESGQEARRIFELGGDLLFLESLATNPSILVDHRLTLCNPAVGKSPVKATHIAKIRKDFYYINYSFFGLFTLAYAELGKWPAVQQSIPSLTVVLDRLAFSISGDWRLAWVFVIRARRFQS